MAFGKYTGKYQKKRIRRVPLSAWLCYALVVTMALTGITLSGYVSSASDQDGARVAVMGAGVQALTTDQIYICPGEKVQIPFSITNTDALGRVSEVTLNYSITVENIENNLPLTWELYSGDAVAAYSGRLNPGQEQTLSYSLEVTWPAEQNASAMAFEVDALRITVTAEQVQTGGAGA